MIDLDQSKSTYDYAIAYTSMELRLAKAVSDDFIFYYDLTNSNWSAVKITPEGWTFENNPPILFKRFSNQLHYNDSDTLLLLLYH